MSSWASENAEAQPLNRNSIPKQPLNHQDSEQSTRDGEVSTLERAKTDRSFVEAVRSEVTGWRAWVTGLGSLALAVLILNSVLTGLAYNRRHNYPDDQGLATFYEANCTDTKRVKLVISLGINILASCLLGASNYCMQVLISPLREEVDRAHDKKIWLFIGTPNVKNLFHINYKRRIIWTFLFLTSVPLHLFWNAAVVHTIISNNYYVAGVSQDYAQGAPMDITAYNTQPWFVGQEEDLSNWLTRARSGSGLSTLSSQECIDAYTNNFVDEYSNLVMVMDTNNATNSLLFAGTYISKVLSPEGLGDLWPCGFPAPHTQPCGFARIRDHNGTNWTPLVTLTGTAFEQNDTYLTSLSATPVSYCIAEKPFTQCRLSANPSILIIVLVCNAVKLIGIMITWFYADLKDDKCITSGELIRSYIRRPDPRFYNRCLAGIHGIKKYPEKFWDASKPWSMTWEKRKERYWRGVPGLIWLFYIIPAFVGTIIILGVYFGYHLERTIYTGFGTPSLDSTLPWTGHTRPIKAALVANLPQILASYIYVGCNAVLTGIWAQEEIMHYSKSVLNVLNRDDHTKPTKNLSKRKQSKQDKLLEAEGPQALRVTQPRGGQRETYYLTLPWASSIPLLLSSIALHWFISESLFLLRVAVVDTDGVEEASNLITTVGYSSAAILAVILTLFVQILTIMGIGLFKKYDVTMPLVGGCSAAIGAIAQPPVDHTGNAQFPVDIDLGKLYWGVVGRSTALVTSTSAASGSVKQRKIEHSNDPREEAILSVEEERRRGLDPDGSEEKTARSFEHYQHATFWAEKVEPLVGGKVYA